MYAIVVIVAYLLAGGFVWWHFVDQDQMKKEVPYGERPATVPLSTYRTIMCACGTLTGLPVFLVLVPLFAVQRLIIEAESWLAKRRIKHLIRNLKRKNPEAFKSFEMELIDSKEKQNDNSGGTDGGSKH